MTTRYNFFGGLVTDGLILNLDAAKLQSYPGTGTVWYDLSGNNNNGTLTNGPTLTGSGKNLAIRFDGSDDYVNLSNIFNFERTTPFTGSFWFKTTTSGTAIRTAFGKAIITSPYTGYQIGLNVATGASNDAGKVGIVMVGFPFTNISRKQTAINYNNNTWTQATLTYNGNSTRSGINIFINGTLSGAENYDSENITGTLVNNANFEIGARDGTNQPYLGEISTTQMYNRVLSPFEIYQNFNALKGRYGIPDIVTSGLTLNLDAGNPYSYNPLNTSSTNWVDTTYLTTGGTLTNGTFYSGGTMVFDGVDDYVNYTDNNSIDFSSDFSICTWIYPKTPGISTQTPFSKKQNGVDAAHYALNISNGTSKAQLYIYSLSPYPLVTSNLTLLTNTWYNICLIYNNTLGTGTIYINGSFDSINTKSSGTFTSQGNTPFQIGRFGSLTSAAQHYNGNVSTTQMYNRALSASEVQQNFNALRGRYGI